MKVIGREAGKQIRSCPQWDKEFIFLLGPGGEMPHAICSGCSEDAANQSRLIGCYKEALLFEA